MTAYPAFAGRVSAWLSAMCLACLAALALSSAAPSPPAVPGSHSRASEQVPPFVPNRGQVDARVRYYSRSASGSAYFTERKLVLDLHRNSRAAALELRFAGANPHPRIVAGARAPGVVNYLTGTRRHARLPTFADVRYRDLWPGVDLVFHGGGARLKYE